MYKITYTAMLNLSKVLTMDTSFLWKKVPLPSLGISAAAAARGWALWAVLWAALWFLPIEASKVN